VADFAFDVNVDGTVTIDPRYAGVAQTSGATLTISGVRVTIDGRQLSHGLLPVSMYGDHIVPLSEGQTHEFTYIPAAGYGFQPASGIVADFAFDVNVDGTVTVKPRYGGVAQTAGQTLTIYGYRVIIDGQLLSYDLIPLLLGWAGGALSRVSTHDLSLIPASGYAFEPAGGIGSSFTLTLDVTGAVSVSPSGLLAQRSPLVGRLFDDFTTGTASFTVSPSTVDTRHQAGAVLGGVRSTTVSNAASSQGTSVRLDVGGPDRLQLALGTSQQVRLEVSYGFGDNGVPAPLGLNMHDGGVDRIRTTISHLEGGEVDFSVTIFTAGGTSTASARVGAGQIEFRFVDFRGPAGQDFSNVSRVVFAFQGSGPITIDTIESGGPLLPSYLMRWDPHTTGSQILAVHAALLHSSEIVFFGGDEHDPGRHFLGRTQPAAIDTTRIYDCETGAIRVVDSPQVPLGTIPAPDLFCCGHSFLPNGHLLVAGGTETWLAPQSGDPAGAGIHQDMGHFTGVRYTWDFDPTPPVGHNPWSRVADMSDGRWYPTLMTLSDGACLALSGHVSAPLAGTPGPVVHTNLNVDIFSGSWQTSGVVPDASISYYPRVHLLPNGEVFCVSAMKDKSQAWQRSSSFWRVVAPAPTDSAYNNIGATSVLLPLLPPDYEARLLLAGSAKPVIMSPLAMTPQWEETSPRQPIAGSNSRARTDGCAVILPTKEIMMCGGFDGPRAMLESELFDPDTGRWVTLPDGGTASVPRFYHSVALLMPDGRVFTAGTSKMMNWSYHNINEYILALSGQPTVLKKGHMPMDEGDAGVDNRETRIEIYEPPYYSRTDRPQILSSPSNIGYGDTFVIGTPDADRIREVALLRAGSVTHAFNTDQRYIGLRFTHNNGQLQVASPPAGNIAPPGWYLLFIVSHVDGQPVPSKGTFIQLVAGGASGIPALIQSRFGRRGNFEIVSPIGGGGMAHTFQNNDGSFFWSSPIRFGIEVGVVDAVTMIQSNFGDGNLEVVARVGNRLAHFSRASHPPFAWSGAIYFVQSGVSGNPVLIQSRFGTQGNFEIVTPLTTGGLAHFSRDNDNPALPWSGAIPFGIEVGVVDAVTMIQSNFGAPKNLEVVARVGDELREFTRDAEPPFNWHVTPAPGV
jgi:hypothetical protein